MSKAETLLKRLLVAGKGVSTSERQAEARVKTNDYFNLNKAEMKTDGLLATIKEVEVEIQGLSAAASEAGNTNLAEAYDASLTVFAKWSTTQAAA